MSRKLLAAALAAAVVAYGSIAWGVDYTYNAENVDSNTQWYDGSDSGPLLSDSDIAPSPGIITNGTTDSIYIATPGGGDWTERYTDTGLPDGTYLDLTSRGDTGILNIGNDDHTADGTATGKLGLIVGNVYVGTDGTATDSDDGDGTLNVYEYGTLVIGGKANSVLILGKDTSSHDSAGYINNYGTIDLRGAIAFTAVDGFSNFDNSNGTLKLSVGLNTITGADDLTNVITQEELNDLIVELVTSQNTDPVTSTTGTGDVGEILVDIDLNSAGAARNLILSDNPSSTSPTVHAGAGIVRVIATQSNDANSNINTFAASLAIESEANEFGGFLAGEDIIFGKVDPDTGEPVELDLGQFTGGVYGVVRDDPTDLDSTVIGTGQARLLANTTARFEGELQNMLVEEGGFFRLLDSDNNTTGTGGVVDIIGTYEAERDATVTFDTRDGNAITTGRQPQDAEHATYFENKGDFDTPTTLFSLDHETVLESSTALFNQEAENNQGTYYGATVEKVISENLAPVFAVVDEYGRDIQVFDAATGNVNANTEVLDDYLLKNSDIRMSYNSEFARGGNFYGMTATTDAEGNTILDNAVYLNNYRVDPNAVRYQIEKMGTIQGIGGDSDMITDDTANNGYGWADQFGNPKYENEDTGDQFINPDDIYTGADSDAAKFLNGIGNGGGDSPWYAISDKDPIAAYAGHQFANGKDYAGAVERVVDVARSFNRALNSRVMNTGNYMGKVVYDECGNVIDDCGGYKNRIWADYTHTWSKQNRREYDKGNEYRSNGVNIGYDHFTSSGITFGAAFGYSKGDYDNKGALSDDNKINNYSGGLYLGYNGCSGFFTQLSGTYTHSDYKMKSKFMNTGLFTDTDTDFEDFTPINTDYATDRAKFHSGTWSAGGLVGYEFRSGGFSLTPTLGLYYYHTKTNSFNTSSARRGLRYTYHSLEMPVELTAKFDLINIGEASLAAYAKGGYTYNFNNKGIKISHFSLGGADNLGGGRFVKPGRSSWNAGGGLQARIKGVDIYAEYEYYGRKKYHSHNVNAGIGFSF